MLIGYVNGGVFIIHFVIMFVINIINLTLPFFIEMVCI